LKSVKWKWIYASGQRSDPVPALANPAPSSVSALYSDSI